MKAMRPLLVSGAVFFLSYRFLLAQSGTWQLRADMPTARQELATSVLNGKIYVIAGFDSGVNSTATVDVFNPRTSTWASAHPLPNVNNHNAAAVAGGRLYSFGGASNLAFVYDPVSDNWTSVASMHNPHDGTPSVAVIDDKIYVAGGAGTNSQKETERYDPATSTWEVLAPMNLGRNHSAGGAINGKFYVAGGRGFPGSGSALEVYDPQTNKWTALANVLLPTSGCASGIVDGQLYLFGGEGPSTVFNYAQAYNPATNTWRTLPSMPTAKHGIWGSVIGTQIYLPGGANEPGYGPTEEHDVFTVQSRATFGNISTRANVGTGNRVLIAGFIFNGTVKKDVIIRGLGPSVPVSGTLSNPALSLYDSAGQLLAQNDNWRDGAGAVRVSESALAPVNDSEAAISVSLSPGAYTAIVDGVGGATGIALAEVYDLAPAPDSALGNISTRAFVQSGNDVVIGGFITSGTDPRRVVLRALGPSIPVAGTLPDPVLSVYDAQGMQVAANDNWRSSQESELIGTNLAPGNDFAAAIVLNLPVGGYTAIVQGKGQTGGIALVEAYSLD